MKYLITFLLGSLFMSLPVSAQSRLTNQFIKTPIMIDCGESSLQVVYLHSVIDPILQKSQDRMEIIVVGSEASIYLNYGQYQWNNAVDSIGRDHVTYGQAMALARQFDVHDASSIILKSWSRKELIFKGHISTGSIYYTESIPDFSWETIDGTDSICGHLCKKAKTVFRGRTWIANYTTDLSPSDGPWKFRGLPGMILKVVSEDGEHTFEARDIFMATHPVRYEEYSKTAIKTTREKYNKSLLRHKTNPSQSMSGIISSSDGRPLKLNRLFYNPEEKQ